MNFYKMQSDRVSKILSRYRKARVVQGAGLLLAAGAISIFYSNCGNFNASKSSESPSSLINNGNGPLFGNNGSVIGNVERLVDTGSTLVLSGWACVVGSNTSAVLEIGAGDDSMGTTTAYNIREDNVKIACQSTSNNHGFSFEISGPNRNIYAGKEPYVKLNGIAIPSEPNLIITAVPPEPVTPTLVGYLDSVTYQSNGAATASGWACVTGQNEPVNVSILSNVGDLAVSGVANEPAGLGVKAACGTSTINHGFTIYIPSEVVLGFDGSMVIARGSSGGLTAFLNGEFPVERRITERPVLPFTAELPETWTGPGGSTWNHKATLNSAESSGAVFSIYSSSSNSGLIPTFLEQKNDITVTGNGCQDVGQSTRTSAVTGDVYVVTVRACFTRVSSNKLDWDISFTHRALNTTTNVDGGESASHGTISLRPPRH